MANGPGSEAALLSIYIDPLLRQSYETYALTIGVVVTYLQASILMAAVVLARSIAYVFSKTLLGEVGRLTSWHFAFFLRLRF